MTSFILPWGHKKEKVEYLEKKRKDEVKKAESNVTKRLFKEFHSPSATGKPIVSNSTISKTDLEKTAEQMEEFAKRSSDPFGVKNK